MVYVCSDISDVVIYELKEYDIVYDAECPYWDPSGVKWHYTQTWTLI